MKFVVTVTLLFLLQICSPVSADVHDVWFGTSGNNAGQPQGIWHATFDTESGSLSEAKLALEIKRSGWITWHPTLPIIYSTAFVNRKAAICAIKMADDKSLSIAQTIHINDGSCFLTTDKTGSVLVSTQYGGGTVISIPIDEDGMLVDQVQEIKHVGGSNVVPGRQKSPHPHYAQISPDNKYVYVPDLGLDQLIVYGIDLEEKKLVSLNKPVDCVKGGGPRHMKIRGAVEGDSRNFAFVLNELAMSVTCFEAHDDGTMKLMHTEPTLTEEQKATVEFNSASEIRIHPNGKFIYTANRGHDSISLFHFKTSDFQFAKIQTVSVHGEWPRNFNLTPDGKWLLASGAKTNSISIFAINEDTGKLIHQRKTVFVPGSICVSIR